MTHVEVAADRPRVVADVAAARRPVTSLAAAVLAVVAVAAGVYAPVLGRHGNVATEAVRAVLVGAFALAGTFAVVRRPFERQGVLVLGGTALGAVAGFMAAVVQAHAHGTAVGATALSIARFVEPVAVALLPVAAMHLLLGLPDGSCRLSRAAIVGGYVVGAAIGVALWTRRPALPLWPVGVEAIVGGSIGVIGSQRRYTRSRGVERQRMQWFGWAIAVGGELLVVSLALRLLWGWPTRPWLVVMVASLPLAVALAFGSSRRVAGRIDRILAHTVSLAGLTGIVVIVYLVIVVGLGRTPTRHERSLLALSMVAAAVAALLYGPARQRLTQYANRIVYGEREAPDTVLRTFGSRLSRAIPMDELLLQVAESLRKTLGLSSAEVWTGSGGYLEKTVSVPDTKVERLALSADEQTVVARAGVTGTAWVEIWLPALLHGREDSIVRVAPTTHSGQVLGLIVAVRPPNSDQFTADDDTMLTELARQVGLALHNVELDSALQASLDEVRRQADELQASRARIVAASDAARRQIERNLHDGAQQHLVALAVNVRLARQLAQSDPEASAQILDQLGEGLQEAVQELRALAHGIYPPLLIDRGISEALRSAAGRAALPTEVEAAGLRRFTPDEEAAVYFCCMEALQNAGKHAGESASATVRVWEDGGDLLFEVRDTGAGFDAKGNLAKGAGFVNMSDRVGAIGGSVTVTSAPGQGTTVAGRIPVGAPEPTPEAAPAAPAASH
ncbi:MAG TPA: histidine kinase [Acidimicrobiales bacterium]|nr:histidine kinase [Acidimicrobiales bacterium]